MNRLKLLAVLTSSIFFTACGGSGGSDGGSTGGGSGGANTNVNLTADIVQSTVCNTEIAATNAELVVYDANWAIKSRHKPDAQGKISASIPQTQNVNIAFITQTTTTSGTRTYVESRAQHPVGYLGKFEVSSSALGDCECVTKDVTISTFLALSDQGAQLTGAANTPRYQETTFRTGVFPDTQICRKPNSDWPTLTVFGHNGGSAVAGTLSDYDVNRDLDVLVSASGTSYTAVVDPNFFNASVSHEVNGQFASYTIPPETGDISVIEDLDVSSRVHLRGNRFEQRVEGNQTVNVLIARRKVFDYENENTATLTMPDVSPLISLAETFDNFISSDSTSYQINNADQYTMLSIFAQVSLQDGSTYMEQYYGPIRGNYPESALPSDYGIESQLANASSITLDFSLFRYAGQDVYQTAIQKLSNRSILPPSELFGADWSDYSVVSVSARVELE